MWRIRMRVLVTCASGVSTPCERDQECDVGRDVGTADTHLVDARLGLGLSLSLSVSVPSFLLLCPVLSLSCACDVAHAYVVHHISRSPATYV